MHLNPEAAKSIVDNCNKQIAAARGIIKSVQSECPHSNQKRVDSVMAFIDIGEIHKCTDCEQMIERNL